jgi:hypothetical protein
VGVSAALPRTIGQLPQIPIEESCLLPIRSQTLFLLSNEDLFDSEATLLDERGNIASHMAAFERPFEKPFCAFLPAAGAKIGREAMFEKQEPAFGPRDAAKASNRFCHSGNRAESERADDSVDTAIWQWDSLSREVQKLDIQVCVATLIATTTPPSRGIRRHYGSDSSSCSQPQQSQPE